LILVLFGLATYVRTRPPPASEEDSPINPAADACHLRLPPALSPPRACPAHLSRRILGSSPVFRSTDYSSSSLHSRLRSAQPPAEVSRPSSAGYRRRSDAGRGDLSG